MPVFIFLVSLPINASVFMYETALRRRFLLAWILVDSAHCTHL